MPLQCVTGHGPASVRIGPLDELWLLAGRLLWASAGVQIEAQVIGITADGTDSAPLPEGRVSRAVAQARRLTGGLQASAYRIRAEHGGTVGAGGVVAGPVQQLDAAREPGWIVGYDALVGLAQGLHARLAYRGDPRRPADPISYTGPQLLRVWGDGPLLVAGAGGLTRLDLANLGGAAQVPLTALVAFEAQLDWTVTESERPRGPLGRPAGYSTVQLRGSGAVLVADTTRHGYGPDGFVDSDGPTRR